MPTRIFLIMGATSASATAITCRAVMPQEAALYQPRRAGEDERTERDADDEDRGRAGRGGAARGARGASREDYARNRLPHARRRLPAARQEPAYHRSRSTGRRAARGDRR